MSRKPINSVLATVASLSLLSACTTDPNSPGVEYMPDMYRSPAVEAYVDYGMDPYHYGEELAAEQRNTPSARKPVAGTIAYKGDDATFAMPYPYANTPEDYERAGAELKSPLPLTKENLEAGKLIFERFCIQCHGAGGAGDGSITETAGGRYPVVPSYQSRVDLPDGKMYHTLMYGKGLMGSHASQVEAKERWQVIQYVRTLMTGETPEFNEAGTVAPADTASVADAVID